MKKGGGIETEFLKELTLTALQVTHSLKIGTELSHIRHYYLIECAKVALCVEVSFPTSCSHG